MQLLCPVCGERLQKNERSYLCPKGHSFDIARQGYVNLLPVQQKKSLHPGDTKEQVAARRAFLDGGYYAPILETLKATAIKHHASGPIVDIGCGEGYYSGNLASFLNTELVGMDISKEAVRYAAGKYKNGFFFCGTASHLPVEDHSVGLMTSLFALTMPEEFHRVLSENGLYFQVLAAKDHLLNLKKIIYGDLTDKEKDSVPELPGFSLVESAPIRFTFTVEGAQVQNLLSMTPHVYRITKDGAARLAATESLTDTASCVLNVYAPLHFSDEGV